MTESEQEVRLFFRDMPGSANIVAWVLGWGERIRAWPPRRPDLTFTCLCKSSDAQRCACQAQYDVLLKEITTLRESLERLREIVDRELSYYAPAWVADHAKDDHLVTLDHKDEVSLMETLIHLREALQSNACGGS